MGVCMWKKIGMLLLCLLVGMTAYAEEETPEPLYARSAVLMDADSGRVLFEKNGYERMPMASTTKIMTCILALERGNPEEVVTASSYAARQPKVHLGVTAGERFRLEDLLYSLMLESHNDSAVMIAEHIGGSVEGFADLMNEKAKRLGCEDTYFITPNGLDAVDERGKHATTAADLARIMSYCIGESEEKEAFRRITGTESYTFRDVEKKRTFSCRNHNAFLTMMDGAFSGKTGFTGDAGYCYVGALKRDDRTFVVALLGCGWPNNRTYKWADTRKLMQYGLKHYYYEEVSGRQSLQPIRVRNGVPEDGGLGQDAKVNVTTENGGNTKLPVLMKDGEELTVETNVKKTLSAPVKRGEPVGTISYYLEGTLLQTCPVVAAESVEKITMRWCMEQIFRCYIDT